MARGDQDAVRATLEGRLSGDLLVLGRCPVDLGVEGAQQDDAPDEPATLHRIDGAYDALVIAGWGKSLTPLSLVRALRERVRPGGSLVFVAPTVRPGWRGAQGALLGALKRQAPIPFEELCEAMLKAGLRDVVARELGGSRGLSVVAARVVEVAGGAQESSVRSLFSERGADSDTGTGF